jgi:hypothetical protein
MVIGYEELIEKLKGVTGIKYKELPGKQVNGYDCKGVSYTIDLKQFANQARPGLSGSDAHVSAMLDSLFTTMGTMTGETWISTKHKAMVKTLSNMNGVKMVMEYKNIADWTAKADSFSVPPGYKQVTAGPGKAKPKAAPSKGGA